jgi:GT2 family glycosyltransferase
VARVTVDVVIPTWNGRDLLLDCLEHIERDPYPHRTIVVDDASTDDTVAVVRARHPAVELVVREVNGGFVRAANEGLAHATAEIVVLLNNDANVEAGFLERIVEPFEDARVGTVAGVLVDPASGLIDAAGVEVDGGLAGYSFLHGEPLSRLAQPPPGLVGACGGAAAYRHTALAQAGLLDERLKAYNEDVELALRIRAAGWDCVLAPGARAMHIGSATYGRRSVGQVASASFSRGYVCGRYRVAAHWAALEWAVAAANSIVFRSREPLRQLGAGRRTGRDGPSLEPPRLDAALGPWDALRRRLRAARG